MKAKTINAIWGIVLILAGVLFLAQNANMLALPEQLWKFIFAGLSLLFFATYFINGMKAWGWLFPACIFAALSVVTFMGENKSESPLIGTLIMWSIAIPFLVAFGVDRKNNWWALIPAWVLTVIGGIIILDETSINEDVTAALILLSIALPFFVVYMMNHQHWWALIPAGVLAVIALIVVIASNASEDFVPVLIMAAIALPFFIVYSRSPQNWWALIPAGFLATIAVGLLVIFAIGEDSNSVILARAGGVFFLGWGLTFGVLWLRRAVHDTDWAKWPAAVLLICGLGVIVFGAGFDKLWPLLIILAGVVVLYFGLRKR